jgi:DNA-binding CsgD family transcriptional regulator
MLGESLRLHLQLGDRWRLASVLETIAGSVLVRHDPYRAARLLAASHSLRERLGTPVPPVERPAVEAALADAEGALGPASFGESWASGLGLPVADAVDLANQAMESRTPVSEVSVAPAMAEYHLTDREVAVLRLVRLGLTNREIGKQLFISPGTAGVHVSNILRKLAVTSRVQAAGIAHEMGL